MSDSRAGVPVPHPLEGLALDMSISLPVYVHAPSLSPKKWLALAFLPKIFSANVFRQVWLLVMISYICEVRKQLLTLHRSDFQ